MSRLIYGAGTRAGLVRTENEDRILALPPVFVVADGMGGHAAGGAASSIVVEEFRALAGRVSDGSLSAGQVVETLAEADRRVRSIDAPEDAPTPGTTAAVVVALQQDGHDYWLVLNVGDSRVYRWEHSTLHQVSVDHSLVQELVDAGRLDPVLARSHRDRHVITRAVGLPHGADPDCWLLPASSGTRFLLCSDGLTSVVDDERIAMLLAGHPDAHAAADALLTEVTDRHGRDDVSVVVVDVHGEAAEEAVTVRRAQRGEEA